MSEDDNRADANLLLLCIEHSYEIDEFPDSYSAELLREWKQAQVDEYAQAQRGWPLNDADAGRVLEASSLIEEHHHAGAVLSVVRAAVKGQWDVPVGGQLVSLCADSSSPCARSVDLPELSVQGDHPAAGSGFERATISDVARETDATGLARRTTQSTLRTEVQPLRNDDHALRARLAAVLGAAHRWARRASPFSVRHALAW